LGKKRKKIYSLHLGSISLQILRILDAAENMDVSISHISTSYYVHQRIVEEMNMALMLGGNVQDIYGRLLKDSISINVNPLFVFNLIEVEGEKKWTFGMNPN
jgi:ABC-type tungstate transport system substrate-binding protein